MRVIIYGNAYVQPEAVSGTEYAVCYLDSQRGTFSNDIWRAWFSSGITTILDGSLHRTITFLGPCVQFPYTTHYTVIASDGHVHEYLDRAGAIQGFYSFLPQEGGEESDLHTVFPQLCYYHEVTCPGGIYRLEFLDLVWMSRDTKSKGVSKEGEKACRKPSGDFLRSLARHTLDAACLIFYLSPDVFDG